MANHNTIESFAVSNVKRDSCGKEHSPRRFLRSVFYNGTSALALLLAVSAGAQAQEKEDANLEEARGWQYTANTNAAFTLTDNVLLTQQDPDSDFITSLTAGVQVFNATRGGTINFNYQLSYDLYINTDELNGLRHDLLTQNTFVVSDDLLFVDVNASIREQAASRNLRTPATTRTIDSNQTMVLTGSVSPYIDTSIANRVGVIVRGDYSTVRYRRTDVSGPSRARDDDTLWGGSFSFSELDTGKRLHWELSGRASGDDDDFSQQGANLALRFRVTENARLIARGGHDKTDGRVGGRDYDDSFWRAGVEFEPIRDSYIRFEGGERYGGPSYDAEVRYDVARAIRITASYQQELRTDQNEFVDFLNDYEPFDPGTGFSGIVTEDPFSPYYGLVLDGDIVEAAALSDTGRLAVSGAVGKVEYTLAGSYQLREYEENLGLEGPFEDEIVSATLSLSRGFGRRTMAGLSAQYTDQESDLPTLGEDDFTVVFGREIDSLMGQIFASYMLSPATQVSMNYTWSEREDQDGIRVEENVVMLTIAKSW